MNTRQIINLEDRITTLEAENAVAQRTISELTSVIEHLQRNYNITHRWAIIGQEAVELAMEALKLDPQEVRHESVVLSLVYSEAMMTAEAKQLHAEHDAIIAAVNDAIDTDATTAPAAVNELIDYHFHMVNGMQADCNRLKAQLEASEASRAAWEKKAVEMSVTAFLRRQQLEAVNIEAAEIPDVQ